MHVKDIQQKAAPVFEKYGVMRARVFGSAARNELDEKSDIDLVVTPGTQMDLIEYMRFKEELEDELDKEVDLLTDRSINKRLRPYIEDDLRVIYEQK
jgi:predicted nucleotidyltransferase